MLTGVPYLSTISVFSHLVQIIILIPPFSRLRRYPFGVTSVLKNLHRNPFGQQKKSLRQPVCIRRGINTAASCHLPQQIPYTQKRNLRANRSQAQKKTVRTAQKAAFPGDMLPHKAPSPEKQNHLYQLPNSLIYAISFLSQPLIYFYCLTG